MTPARLRSVLRPASLAGNAAFIAFAFAISRVLGMVREIAIASRFGTGYTYDAYVAAFRIPDLIFYIVMSGAFGSAFIPVFGGFLAKGEQERAWTLANALLTWIIVGFAGIALLITVLAEPLVRGLIAPELPPESQDLAVDLTRLLLASPLLLGLGAAGKGMLEAQQAFVLPAVAPILYNVGIIFGALALTPAFGIYGLAIGVIAGSLAHAGVQLGALLRGGMRPRATFSLRTPGLREVGRLMGPRIVGQSASQANLIVMTNVASRLAEGSISALNYAQSLIMLPHGVLAMSLSTVMFPRLVRDFEQGNLGEFRRVLNEGLRTLLFLSLPAAAGLLVFRTSIVQVLFQYGSFDAAATDKVAVAVGFFALGLVGRALGEPLIRTFYAMRDTRTPVAVSVLMVVANIALSWMLASRMGHAGLALSMSITYLLRTVALAMLLSRRTGGFVSGLVAPASRMLVPLGLMTALAIPASGMLAQVTDPATGRGPLGYLLFLLVIGGSAVAYLAVAWTMRLPDAIRLAGMVRRRLGRLVR